MRNASGSTFKMEVERLCCHVLFIRTDKNTQETAVAFHVFFPAVCIPDIRYIFLQRTRPILKRAPWMHSLHTQRPGRSSAWLFGVPRPGVPPGRVAVTQSILSPQHQEPARAVGREMIYQSHPDRFKSDIEKNP